jgi:Tol biopolymer transport system component
MTGFVSIQPRWLAAMALALLAGCTADPGAPTAEPSPDSQSAGPSAEPSGTPVPATPSVLAEGVISTEAEEYRISFSPDGETAYFGRGTGFFPQTRQATIMETRLVEGEWSEPTVAPFSGTYPDLDPWVAPDGESIYFSSIRPIADVDRSDVELFRVDRVGDGWSEPVHMAALGSELDELGASVTADGSIWFASDRPGGAGGWDLYTATSTGGEFAEPEPVQALNSSVWEFNPAIDAGGTTLIFTSILREGASGLGDLYVSTRAGDAWSDPRPLPLNSGADEYHASLSPDGTRLYFVRRGANGDLYEVPWAGERRLNAGLGAVRAPGRASSRGRRPSAERLSQRAGT